jgi:hypothetical protein
VTAQVVGQPAPPTTPIDRLRSFGAWRYEGGKRDLRFDFLRGFAVFAMVVDHIGGPRSPFYFITGGDRFFVSAAEAFVFLSGLLMGMVNGGLIRRGDIGEALTRVLRRAGMLYTLTVGLTMLVAVLPLVFGLSWAPDTQGASVIDYIVGVLTLHRTTYLIDVMLLYTILVLAAEPVLLLLRYGRTRLVLAGSWGLWLVWQGWPQSADIWPIVGDELFTVAAWQALFMTALVIGYHRRKLEWAFQAIATPQALVIAGVALVGFIAFNVTRLAPLTALTGVEYYYLNEWFFAKNDVAPGRILAFAALFVFAYALLTLAWRPLERGLGWLLLPFGQNALSAYVIHIFIVGAAGWLQAILPDSTETVIVVTLYQLTGVLIVWTAIRLRPLIASSLEQLESAWSLIPATTLGGVVTRLETQSLDVQLAQAQARQGVDMLR